MTIHLQQASCDPDRLELYLGGQLSAAGERELTTHLNGCEACRVALAQRAAEPECWREAEMLLGPSGYEASDVESAGGREGAGAVERRPLAIQAVLDALGPTDDPQMLGRLGSYEISGVVGAGGMGVVLKAIDKSLDRTVAIKVLAPHLAASGAARKRFAREAQAAAAVLHPNVIAIHSVSNDEVLPYLVMPYLRGPTLQKRLDEQGPLSLQEILRIGAQIASGLAAAHAQGLVHRDITPANILLEEGVERVTITDFGLARTVDDATITHSGMIAGTPQYMSPEQARGEAVDGRSDLFSLGSLLYATCTGRPPFRAETSYGVLRRITDDAPTPIRQINPDIPQWLCTIVTRLMSKQASDRFASAEEVADLLAACLAHVQQPAAVPLPPSLAQASKRFTFLSLSRSGLGAVAMMVALGIGLLGMFLWQSAEPPDISGRWSGEGWGQVELRLREPGQYAGTYTDTFGKETGKLELAWSRIERRFKGTWHEGEHRFGKISVRLVDDEVRGAWTANDRSRIQPGVPELADLLWVRESDASRKRQPPLAPRILTDPSVSTSEPAGVLSVAQVVSMGNELYHSRRKVTVRLPVAAVKEITVLDENGDKQPQWLLASDTTADFSIRLLPSAVEALKRTGVSDIPRSFTGKTIEVTGEVYGVGMDIISRPDTIWTYHMDVTSLDQIRFLDKTSLDPSRASLGDAIGQRLKLDGVVLAVQGQELVEISIGSDDGVAVGQSFVVFRDRAYLGQITVVRAGKDKSVGRIELHKGEIRSGDRVATEPEKKIPGTEGSSSKGDEPRFCEAQEVVLSMDSLKFMLDLDTGKTMDPPATIRPEQEQMDLQTDQVQPYHYPTRLNGRGLMGLEVKSIDWDVSAADVRRALAGDAVGPLKEMDLGPEKNPTYFFQTRDGAMGVLQLLALVDEPKGIRFRYKTVEKAPEGSPAKAAAANPQLRHRIPIGESVNAIALSADGQLIAVAKDSDAGKRSVEIVDAGLAAGKTVVSLPLTTQEEDDLIAATANLPRFEVKALAFSPDGSLLAVGTGIGQVKVFDPRSGDLVQVLDDTAPRLADRETPESWKPVKRVLGSVNSLAFSPDGSRLAVCGESFADFSDVFDGVRRLDRKVSGPGRLKVWDVKAAALKHDLAGLAHVHAVSFSSDGSMLASAGSWEDDRGHGAGVVIWNPGTGAIVRTLPVAANGGAHAVALSSDSKLVAIGTRHFDKDSDTSASALTLAHARSGIVEWQRTTEGFARPIGIVPFGKGAVVHCGTTSIKWIDMETGAVKHEIISVEAPHGGRWTDFALAAPAGRLAIGGVDRQGKGYVEIWDFAALDGPSQPLPSQDRESQEKR